MGIINCTPDSFYAESRSYSGGAGTDPRKALETARRMIEEGADILDLGGESTRPGSSYIDAGEEQRRLLPVIEGIRKFSDIPISVDTRKAEVASKAVGAGANMINDISALEDDPSMAAVVSETGVSVILMHKKGEPSTMQDDPYYDDVLGEVGNYLRERAASAEERGIPRDRIILDPGIGFGKRLGDNLKLLRNIKELKTLGYPLLVGASRKGFIGSVLGGGGEMLPAEERLTGTLTVHMWSYLQGVSIVRVHDVRPHREMRAMLYSMLRREGA